MNSIHPYESGYLLSVYVQEFRIEGIQIVEMINF